MIERFVAAALIVIFLNACSSSDSTEPNTIRYRVTFTEAWNVTNFPTQFPPNSHFSSLIGAVHGPASDFVELGLSASNGIEAMAETGSTSQLRTEIDAQIALANALSVISGGAITNSNTSVSAEFEVEDAYPRVSLFSMVAPSPDWFIGVDSLDLSDGSGGFVTSKTVDLLVYDAGTDNGASFTSANSDANTVVTLLSCANTTTDCGFNAGKGTDGVESIGRFVFDRIQ